MGVTESGRQPACILAGKVVLVTGAGSGIGEATARRCARLGATVAGFDITSPAGNGWLDVGDEGAVRQAVANTVASYGRVDAVVHAAGIVGETDRGADELARTDWERVITTNLTGAWLVAKYSLPVLQDSSGTFVLVGSGAGVHNAHRSVAYATSKAGLHGLCLTLEETWRRRGVNIVNLLVGSVDTPLSRRHDAGEQVRQARKAEHLMLEADELAELIAVVVSPSGRVLRGGIRTW